jgi:hypothetical protein
MTFELLGRHVLEGAEDGAFGRQVLSGLSRKDREARQNTPRLRGRQLRETEVDELDARLRDHHVAGLEIPMDDPLPVRLLQRVGDLETEAQHLLERERPFREALGQRLPFQELHDQVLDAVLIPDVMQCADVGMRELRNRFCLALETVSELGVL